MFSLFIIIFCIFCSCSKSQVNDTLHLKQTLIKDYDTYTLACKKALGEIPSFSCNKDSIELNPTHHNTQPPGCDNPSIAMIMIPGYGFDYGCKKAMIGVKKNKDTVWIHICRELLEKNTFVFNAIGYSIKTGETCFLLAMELG